MQSFIAECKVFRNLHALLHHVDADNLLRSEFSAESCGGEPYRTQACDQDGMVTVDADLLKTLIHSSESACHLRAVGVRERIGKGDEVLLFGDHVVGHSAVALPAVSAAILFA